MDALALPVEPSELVARIEGRCAARAAARPRSISDELGLDPRESRALTLLFEAGPSGLSRTALNWSLWGEDLASSRRLDVMLSSLRRKLKAGERTQSIEIRAQRGAGYRLL